MGIVICILSTWVSGLYFGFRCFPATRLAYITTILVATLLAVTTPLYIPKSRVVQARERVLVFIVGFGLVPLAHWTQVVT